MGKYYISKRRRDGYIQKKTRIQIFAENNSPMSLAEDKIPGMLWRNNRSETPLTMSQLKEVFVRENNPFRQFSDKWAFWGLALRDAWELVVKNETKAV